MRRVALFTLFLVPALAIAQVPGGIVATPQPVGPTGVKATCDLPASQHLQNLGGNDRTRDNPRGEPGRGLGLCVFTAVEIAARWQWVPALHGFRDWMTHHPGGGHPDKLDQMARAFCRDRRASVPVYVQHTGGDEAFLDLAVKTRRLPAITYAGMDGFYKDALGRDVWINHMVNLAHFDAETAAIIDNNRPGVWVWMTRKDLLVRWRARGGGWAIALLAPPPPPHSLEATLFTQQCGPNGCRVPVRSPAIPPPTDAGAWVPNVNGREWGFWRGGVCLARCFADGRCEAVDANGMATGEAIAPPAPLPMNVETSPATAPNYGIDPARVYQRASYSISGVEVTRAEAHAALTGGPLIDDSDRWHLTAVGDAAFVTRFQNDVAALGAEVRGKLHVQCYAASDWPVAFFRLPTGVSLRRPASGGVAEQVGTLSASDYASAKLADLLAPLTGTRPTPAKPAAVPGADPQPPTASPDRSTMLALIVAAIALCLSVFRRGA